MPARKGNLKRSSSRTSAPGPPIKAKKTKIQIDSIRLRHGTEPGVVLTFGQGDVGQLGLGEDVLERSRPTLVPNVDNIVDVCAGGMHTVCLTADGKVITFGCNDEGALGRDTSKSGSEMEPGMVDLEGRVIQVTAGDSHSAALLENGKVFAWGAFRDSSGTMGLTVKGIEKSPLEVLPGVTVVKIASGADHLVMLSDEGHLYTCGCGEQGQLGRVPERGANRGCRQGMAHLLAPGVVTFKPTMKTEFQDIWAGSYCSYAKEKSKGRIFVYGLNNFNQLGLERQKCQFHPVLSEALSGKNWVEISGGQHHTLALDDQGVVYCLGRKEYGRLGLGENCEDAPVPTRIPKLEGVKCVNIACGAAVSFAVSDKGEVYAWGMGTNGQLGTGEEDDVFEPQLIKGKQLELRFVMQVSAGGQHTALLAREKP